MGLSSAIFYGLALLAFVIATELVGFIAIEVIVIAVGFFISASVLAAGALVRAAPRLMPRQAPRPARSRDQPVR